MDGMKSQVFLHIYQFKYLLAFIDIS